MLFGLDYVIWAVLVVYFGGMLLLGIPRYRLPREVIDREVAMLKNLGVEFQFDTRFGQDVTLRELKQEGFDAFFFAIGAHKSFKLGIPGETEFPQVIDAIAIDITGCADRCA